MCLCVKEVSGQRPEMILESVTDSAEWTLEVERVLPQLKVSVRTDIKVRASISKNRYLLKGDMLYNCQQLLKAISALMSKVSTYFTLLHTTDLTTCYLIGHYRLGR